MAGLSFFKRTMKLGSLLVLSTAILALGGCGQGNGPQSFQNQPATPLPPGGGDGPPFDSGLLTNGDFEAGKEPWVGNAANVQLIDGNYVNFADVGVAGQPFDVNLSQVVAITNGETYTLTFKARSNRNRTIEAGIGLNEDPFTSVTEIVNLTPDWQTFQYDLTATFGIPNSRVLFDMGADTGEVVIDDVSLFVEGGGGPGVGTPIDPDAALFRTEGDEDLVIPDDYDERTGFGSGSIIEEYFDDDAYSRVLSVFSGAGYGANVAQVGFIGFRPGSLGFYGTVDFKVRGMPNFVIFVKLFDGVDTLRINLTSSGYSEDLGNGWFQVSIPLTRFSGVDEATGIVFESDNTSLEQFRMLLTDIGFSGEGSGGGPADRGEVPEVIINAADGAAPDLVVGYDPFGSGTGIVENFAGDRSFANVVEVKVGGGYGGGALAQVGLTGLAAGFATGFDEFLFKVKGLDADNTILAKLEEPFPGASVPVQVDLTAPPAGVTVTDLGDGWSQVVIPISAYGDVSTFSQIVFQTLDGAYAVDDIFYLADIGFNNADVGGGPADRGQIPEVIINAADGAAPDLVVGYDPFGSGTGIVENFAGDSSFTNVVEVKVGGGYGGGALAQVGLTGLAAGFATGFDEFLFKVKGLDADNTILAKLEEPFPGASVPVQVDLTAPPAGVTVTDLGDGWSQVVIPISAYGDVSTFSQIVFQTLDGAYAVDDIFYLADIGFNNADAGGGGGELVVDGGFETAGVSGLQSPWFVFENGGTVSVSDVNNNGGTYAARLQADASSGAASFPILKVERLGAGSLTNGGPVTISFDAIDVDNVGAGKVFVAEFFTERADPPGGATNEVLLGGYGLSGAWQTYTYNTNLGADAAGGVSLLFKADCGANPACTMDVFIDNVTITVP